MTKLNAWKRAATVFLLCAATTIAAASHDSQPEIGLANQIFREASAYLSGGMYSYSIAVGDLNRDGKPDLVMTDYEGCGNCQNGLVSVFLGNGDGTFQNARTYGTGGNYADSVAIADVNGDGIPDLLVANFGGCSDCGAGGSVAVLLGKGDGTFREAVNYPSGGYRAYSVAVADVNGDGKPDLLVANDCSSYTSCANGGVVSVLLGNGNGTFQTAVSYSTGMLNAVFVAVADVNDDGKPDLLVATNCDYLNNPACSGSSGSVAVLLGNGNGTFQPQASYGSGGYGAISLTVADVNGDHQLDLVVANDCFTATTCQDGGVGVLLGNGNGTFQPAVSYGPGDIGAFSVAVADVDGDGNPDLVVATGYLCGNCADGDVSVLLGNGDGTFRLTRTYESGGDGTNAVAVADVNGDGKPDILVANVVGGVRGERGVAGVLLGDGKGSFQGAGIYGDGQFVLAMAIGDLNGDGKPDLVEANQCRYQCTEGDVSLYLGRGDGSLKAPVHYATGGIYTWGLAIADVNGDGKPDLIVASECGGSANCYGVVGVLFGNGDGTFQKVVPYASGGDGAVSVAVADVNGDGKPDLIVANSCLNYNNCSEGVISVLLGNGDGTFQKPVLYGSGGDYASSVTVADVNGDGKLDLVVANSCADSYCELGSVGVLLGNGDGTFQKAVTYGSGGGYTGYVAVADLNGDGKPDLITSNQCPLGPNCSSFSGPGTIGVLLGDGDGTFQKVRVTSTPGGNGSGLAVADFNGDGKLDVASGAGDALLLGNGDGTLQPPLVLGVEGFGIAVADFNLDGKPDIAGGDATVLLNISSGTGTPRVPSAPRHGGY
jgi:hypothetical protein